MRQPLYRSFVLAFSRSLTQRSPPIRVSPSPSSPDCGQRRGALNCRDGRLERQDGPCIWCGTRLVDPDRSVCRPPHGDHWMADWPASRPVSAPPPPSLHKGSCCCTHCFCARMRYALNYESFLTRSCPCHTDTLGASKLQSPSSPRSSSSSLCKMAKLTGLRARCSYLLTSSSALRSSSSYLPHTEGVPLVYDGMLSSEANVVNA